MAFDAGILSDERANATIAWLVIAVLLLATIERALAGEYIWSGLTVAIVVVSLVPAVFSRRPTAMVSWEALALAAIPVITRSVDLFVGPLAYIAVATLALVVTVELDAFTEVKMPSDFAVAFVVIVTMGIAGLWSIARYASDFYLDTSMLTTQAALMWDLVGATAVGIVAGIVFEVYFRRISPGHTRFRERRRSRNETR